MKRTRRLFKQIGLAIEGGGMRGCVSAGMTAALMSLGLMDSIDAVYGSSAGSLVSALHHKTGDARMVPAPYVLPLQ